MSRARQGQTALMLSPLMPLLVKASPQTAVPIPCEDGGEESKCRTQGLTESFMRKLPLTLACRGWACPLNTLSATLASSPVSSLHFQVSITPLLESYGEHLFLSDILYGS